MSGIFAYIAKDSTSYSLPDFKDLSLRGKNSSSFVFGKTNETITLIKSNECITSLSRKFKEEINFAIVFSGVNVTGPEEVSPISTEDLFFFHDGIITSISKDPHEFTVNTPANSLFFLKKIIEEKKVNDTESAIKNVLKDIKGTANCILYDKKENKVFLFSNHGSLYFAENDNFFWVASEEKLLSFTESRIEQVRDVVTIKLPIDFSQSKVEEKVIFSDQKYQTKFSSNTKVLEYKLHSLRRCAKCILPETMPFIRFNELGVCNYCESYKPKNTPKDKSKLLNVVEKYRRADGNDCIIPFSGGRDSCFALHVAVKELGLKPITYTYDWGMVTDVGRRNIAIMCGELGIENILIADDIEKKRRNIALNFKAWLKKPNLGMINLLTAGDKHFFRYINKVKKDTGIDLNLWGVNPLEVTHFKTGFLGIEPDFEKQKVYASGKLGQLRYHSKRLKHMIESPGYFNRSLWDTYSGEYYRSFAEKKDYYHVFDYWQWQEKEINNLIEQYGWEKASDTPTTWRIGDGTAGIFNYIYYTLAGFTEHDTFRSNQIREGQITREEALKLIEEENSPCYDNIRWYMASIGFDFEETIKCINSIKRQHELLY